MTIPMGWLRRPFYPSVRAPVLRADSKGPWGTDDDAGGPRNPWAVPPGARKGTAKPSALDELLARARSGGGGNGGGGFGGLPGRNNPRALWAIGVAVILVAWVLYTSFHPIGPQQRGVVTYFGRYSGTLEPGIRMTLPAPIASVTRLDVQKIRTENFPENGGENLMLTGDQNIIDLAYAVRWDIANPQDFVFELANPQETVRAAAESAMRSVLANTTFTEAAGAGRAVLEGRVGDLTQAILNSYHAGVRIQGVSIKQASAPSRIIDDFNAVTTAQQGAIANRNQAESYASQVIARAQGEAAAFNAYYEQYKLAPAVTRRRMYYETMEAVLARSDKTIVETPGVTPYLPLKGARMLPDAGPDTGAAATPPPAPQTGVTQ